MRTLLALGLTGIVLGLAAGEAVGQDERLGLAKMAGTLSVKPEPVLSDGHLTGCTLLFEALHFDHAYRQGRPIYVTGHIGLMKTGENLGTVLKVVVNEVTEAGGKFVMKPSAPSRAYLIGNDFKMNLDSLLSATESDTPGALFSVFQPDPTFTMMTDALEAGKLTLAFNSLNGGTDIQMPIELDVAATLPSGDRQRSDAITTNFIKCVVALTEGQ